MRQKTAETDLTQILSEDVSKEVKEAAEISMGTEINEVDEKFILSLASQIIELSEYRLSLSEYLKNRMTAIAPNLTVLLGELVGARLISHAGSLINLAKSLLILDILLQRFKSSARKKLCSKPFAQRKTRQNTD